MRVQATELNTNALPYGVSVIICCYNSSARIPMTLQHLAQQDVGADLPVEIIVVDNASSDDTQTVIGAVWEACGAPFPLTMIKEPTPGIAYARRLGVLQAQYRYGIFCDDDNWLATDYLTCAVRFLDKHPEVGVVGGSSTPVLPAEVPAWFYTHCGAYVIGVQAGESGDITNRRYVWGAGMAFRIVVLKNIYNAGFQHLVLGRTKETLTSGDDNELCAWFVFSGYRLWYLEELRFQHEIPPHRLTPSYYQAFLKTTYQTLTKQYDYYLIARYGKYQKRGSDFFVGLSYYFARFRAFINLLQQPRAALLIWKRDRALKHLIRNIRYQ